MATAKNVMTVAEKYVGVKESPPNSNNVVFNTDYYGRQVNGADYPWCATFVWDVFRIAGASNIFYDGKKVAYCPYIANWGKANGLTVAKGKGEYGDVVLFDWNNDGVADHVGFIVKKNANGSYETIEGNTAVGNDSNGGEVMRRTRAQKTIMMIIRPKYDGVNSKPITTTTTTTTNNSGGNTVNVTMKVLSKGAKGAEVRSLQILLTGNGFSVGSYGFDGDFGNATYNAVRNYQRAKKLEVDGVVGQNTWNKLLKG